MNNKSHTSPIANVQKIYAPESLDGSEGLLAIILRYPGYRVHQRSTEFHTDKNSPLQLATIRFRSGDEIKPHYHLPRKRTLEQTQEVLTVIAGSIHVTVYCGFGTGREIVAQETLLPGDTIIFLSGGHSIRALDDSHVIEVKLGPYTERSEDKVDY